MSQRIKKVILAGEGPNGEDLEQVIDVETEKVLKETIISEEDSAVIRKHQVPEGPQERRITKEEGMPTAAQMTALAQAEREKTIGNVAKELVKEMLAACSENVLKGKHSHLIENPEELPPEVLKEVITKLRALGYTVKKRPEPGKGLWVDIKWPTKTKKPRKKVEAVEPVPKKRGRPSKKKQTQTKKQQVRKDQEQEMGLEFDFKPKKD